MTGYRYHAYGLTIRVPLMTTVTTVPFRFLDRPVGRPTIGEVTREILGRVTEPAS
jgi:hypothetical protein